MDTESVDVSMQNKIGIIIPSYNQGKYLETAILSVLENKNNIDIEIAVVDGGSNDQSLEIIKKYQNNLTVWFSEPDGGQANAINKGIRALSNCEYYMWLNSDDVYESENAVRSLAEYARKYNLDVCYGLSHFISGDGNLIGSYPVEPFCADNLRKRCFLSQPSVLFSKKAWQEVGPINEELKMCLDYEYWIRLAQKYEFGFVEEYIGATRIYEETKTSMMRRQHLKEAVNILLKFYGEVPMQWVVAVFLDAHPNSVWAYVPKRILLVLLRPLKKRIIETVRGNTDD